LGRQIDKIDSLIRDVIKVLASAPAIESAKEQASPEEIKEALDQTARATDTLVVEEPERWRAEMYGKYWLVANKTVYWKYDGRSDFDNRQYRDGNYYRTSEEAKQELVRRLWTK
jgi:hypothetical protein